jgi:hypothetical protein
MEILRKNGITDYFLLKALDYQTIDLFGKDFFNFLFVIYLLRFKINVKDSHMKGLRRKNLVYYLPLIIFHLYFYIDRGGVGDKTFIETIDTFLSFCLFFIIQRDLKQ